MGTPHDPDAFTFIRSIQRHFVKWSTVRKVHDSSAITTPLWRPDSVDGCEFQPGNARTFRLSMADGSRWDVTVTRYMGPR